MVRKIGKKRKLDGIKNGRRNEKTYAYTILLSEMFNIIFPHFFFRQVYTQIVSVSRTTFLRDFKKFEEIYTGFKALL